MNIIMIRGPESSYRKPAFGSENSYEVKYGRQSGWSRREFGGGWEGALRILRPGIKRGTYKVPYSSPVVKEDWL